jgi:hypothetical protein
MINRAPNIRMIGMIIIGMITGIPVTTISIRWPWIGPGINPDICIVVVDVHIPAVVYIGVL